MTILRNPQIAELIEAGMCTNLFMLFIYLFVHSFSDHKQRRKWKTTWGENKFSLLIPLSHLNVLHYNYLITVLVSFKRHSVTKCDPEVACIADRFWRDHWKFPSGPAAVQAAMLNFEFSPQFSQSPANLKWRLNTRKMKTPKTAFTVR